MQHPCLRVTLPQSFPQAGHQNLPCHLAVRMVDYPRDKSKQLHALPWTDTQPSGQHRMHAREAHRSARLLDHCWAAATRVIALYTRLATMLLIALIALDHVQIQHWSGK